jgi:hypothetical protein
MTSIFCLDLVNFNEKIDSYISYGLLILRFLFVLDLVCSSQSRCLILICFLCLGYVHVFLLPAHTRFRFRAETSGPGSHPSHVSRLSTPP